jgi:hypothetical protein
MTPAEFFSTATRYMKKARYFRIPEKPADLERLWKEAEPLDPGNWPSYLNSEDPNAFRYLGSATWRHPPTPGSDVYFAEIDELQAAGVIIVPDPEDKAVHRFYIKAPKDSWYNEAIWSIGVHTGETPFHLSAPGSIQNPVLTRDHVSDVPAAFVADPFMIRVGNVWYMYFEIMNWRTQRGEIGLATSSSGLEWKYQKVVLSEPFHLSYPYVFRCENDIFMIPESYQAGGIRLYRAVDFPTHWSLLEVLLEGPVLVDPSVFLVDERWWMFVDTSPKLDHSALRLFHADELGGPWLEHPMSPLFEGDSYRARPAGRVVEFNGRIIRFAQTCLPYYGTAIRAFEVDDLTLTTYREREVEPSPILGPSGAGWNACGMHQIDAHLLDDGTWLACVDGWTGENVCNALRASKS